jgi:predicted lipid-binding transport protein (Tim44 family)
MGTPMGPPGDRPWDAAAPWDGSDPWAATGQPSAAAPAPAVQSAQPAVRRRPVVMAIGGLLGGLGVAFLLIHFAKIAMGTSAPIVVVGIGIVVGVALAYTLPPRTPRRSR